VRAALSRKLWRDAWRMRGLILAAALVLGAGIALYIMSAGTLASLIATREAYYAQQGMADLSAVARRVPMSVIGRARDMAGVARADARLTGAGVVSLPGFGEPVNAMVHSLAEGPGPGLNAPFLVRGRLPDPLSTRETLVNEAFARAHGLKGGDQLSVVLRGARLDLVITGTAQAPDHIYTIPPGGLTGDEARLAVLWMPRRLLEGPLDQLGAFNELLLQLERGARPLAVVAEVDRLLAPYGGTGAVLLQDQMSDKFLTSEMDQLAVMTRILPPAFLAIAAFLLWVTVGRLIATEREQIGLLKAFGYRDREVGFHYARFALIASALGILIGIVAGRWLGRGITDIYAEFYQFPILLFRSDPAVMVQAAGIGLLAGLLGVIGPVRRAIALAPAIAMQPPAPPRYGGGASAAVGRLARLDEPGRMLLRHLLRFPGRALVAGLGVALALSLAISTSFNSDAVDKMVDFIFNKASRQTATVVFAEVRPDSVTRDLSRMPGVLAVEPFRIAPARLVNGSRVWREALTGLSPDTQMVRPLDSHGRPVAIPSQGVVLSQTLAEQLAAEVGSLLHVEMLDGARPMLELRVVDVVQTYQGTPAWVDLETLNALLLDGPVISGAWLLVDRSHEQHLLRALEELPMVAAITLRSSVIGSFEEQVAENLGIFRIFSLGLAAVIVFGVVFTNARMGLTEQARDLATMRVLGYRPGEVSTILVGGLLLVTLMAIPVGIALGLWIAWQIAEAFSSEMYTIPYAVSTATVGLASLATLGAAVATALAVARRVNRLDLVRTLKSPE
jgi:putative ABC transport system permease protein